MWGTLFTTFSGTGLLEFASLMGVVGVFARTCGCGFFMRIFWCGFLGADFFRGFWGADFLMACADLGVRIFFADFLMACADFGVRIFSADFLAVFPQKKPIKKSHQKIPPKNPHQRSSPRSVSSQYTTMLLLAKHGRSPLSVWVQMHLAENRFSAQMASVGEDERVISTCV